MRALLALTILVGCHRDRPDLTSCAESLGGMWRAPSGTWMIIDGGARLEGYAQFPDVRLETSDVTGTITPLEIGPRSFDLSRIGVDVRGDLHRRFARGRDSCESTVPFRITTCSGHTIELVLSDPAPAIEFSPCAYSPRATLSRREQWRRIQ